jgi:hypothetical protein
MSRFSCWSQLTIVLGTIAITPVAFAEDKTQDLVSFLSGKLVASGEVSDYLGRSTRAMKVNIVGTTEGGVLKVNEDATYSDGEKRKWAWRFTKVGDGRYVGHRADLVGEAKVVSHGNTIEIKYRANEPMKDGKTQELNFAETFEITSAGTANYTVNVSLLFVPVADATMKIRKLDCCDGTKDASR